MRRFADGSELRKIRESKCLSLAELAGLSGVSKGSIGNYETGTRGLGPKALRAISEALDKDQNADETIADNIKQTACLQCTAKDARISDLERQLTDERRVVIEQRDIIKDLSRALAGAKGKE